MVFPRARRVADSLLGYVERSAHCARLWLHPRSPTYVVGRQEEWPDFSRRHKRFFERIESLNAVVTLGLRPPGRDSMDRADIVILMLAAMCNEDFDELMLLCANGYGLGATKLLRGLYERLVAARYLNLHPEEAMTFMAWSAVDSGKRATAILEAFGDRLSPAAIATLEQAIAQGKAERYRFQVPQCRVCSPDCVPCSKTRLNHTWSKLDLVAMAKAVDEGSHVSKWIVSCYLEPTRQAHANAAAFDSRVHVSDEDGIRYVAGPHRREADTALMLGHMLMLLVSGILYERFPSADLQTAWNTAVNDYQEIWEGKAEAVPEGT